MSRTERASEWVATGSRTSGDGYGYSIYRSDDRTRYAALLAFGGSSYVEGQRYRVLVSAATYNDACDQGERFCHVWRQWQTVQRRERAMARGYAVLG